MNTKIASLIAILTILIVSVVGVYARPINSFDVRENKVILPPTKLRADATSYNQVALKWKYSDNGYTFKIYRSDEGKRDYDYIGSSSVTSYTDNSVKADTKYFYRIKAVRKDRSGPYSNTAKAVTPVGPVVDSCVYDSTNTIRLCAKEMNGSVKTAVTTNISGAQYSFIDVDNSLVGYWRMEESNSTLVKDWSSYGNDGILPFAPNGEILEGKFGNSFFRPEAVAPYRPNGIQIGPLNPENFNRWKLAVMNSFTFSAWLNYNSSSKEYRILEAYDIDNDLNDITINENKITFARGFGSLNGNYGSVTCDLRNSSIFEWVHLVVTDKVSDNFTHNAKVYVNGEELNCTGNLEGATFMVDTDFWVNQDYFISSRGTGDIYMDEVMLFNRALTSNEVKSLYDSKANPLSNVFSLPLGNHTMQAYAVDASGNLFVTPVKNLVAR